MTTKWRPIETAPKDNYIEVRRVEKGIVVRNEEVMWDDERGGWFAFFARSGLDWELMERAPSTD